MKKISRRAVTALILAAITALGLGLLCGRLFVNGSQWASHPGNGNLYSGGNLSSGMVRDRVGNIMVQSLDTGRGYSNTPAYRISTLHITGDTYGYIPSLVLNEYAEDMSGYSRLNGIYRLGDAQAELKLTVSNEVCAAAYEALNGRKGCVGVYNYKTGEVICMVSSPSYDPYDMPDVENDTSGQYDGVFVNRFISSTYVPGSIFKLVTTAAAIENIPDLFQRTFYCGGSVDVQGDTIVCAGNHGQIDFETALARSCNCAFAEIAIELGAETLEKYAEKALVGESLSFDGLNTVRGSFDLPSTAESDLAWAGIGQSNDLINPCSYMTFMGAIANGGTIVYPHVLMSVTSGKLMDKTDGQTAYGDRILEECTCQAMKELMRNNVVTIYGDPYSLNICAKSGTAEVGQGSEPHATYAGFLNDSQHPLAFIVIVENGGSGSSTCGAIANTVLSKAVEVLDRSE